VRIDPDVEVIAQDQTWARAARIDAAKEIRAGRPDVALDIAERRRGRHGESLIPEAEVQALEDLRRFDEALPILDGARRAALRQRRSEAAVSLTLDTIRILERLQRFDDAIAEAERLRDSLRSGRGESALDYLVVSTAYLRLLRRSGCEDTARYERAAAEIARLAEATPYRDLGSRPGLLREILAEVGTRTTRLLQFGVGQVGVNRGASARLDEQLDRIEDATVGTEPSGPSGPSGSAATPPGPDSSSAQADLGDLENRASTGRKVSKWAQTVGLDKDFAGALKETFQAETDERYS
jgi:tetratricopeptide (TPR) repeat protein